VSDSSGRVSLRVTVDGERLRYVRRGNGSVLVRGTLDR
jgi:hypothetical protein